MFANSLFRVGVILILTGLLWAWIACPAVGQPAEEEPAAVANVEPAEEPDVTATAFRTPIFRLRGVPNMFGDFLFTGGQIYPQVPGGPNGRASFPPIGGGRVKISENNKALPMDRVFFMFNHFQNGIQTTGNLPSASVDRCTIGLEKTFVDGLWSAELRMPFMGSYDYSLTGFGFAEPEAGNLTVTLKRLLCETYYGAVAMGLGINTPTGGGMTGQIGLNTPDTFTMRNDALYLVPWIGFLSAPNDRVFYQGFLQVDIAANGNRVIVTDSGGVTTDFGRLAQQNLLEVDLSVGYWLHRDPRACYLTGLAGILELHYNTTLQDARIMSFAPPVITDRMRLGNIYNRMDIWNITAGLHAAVGDNTTVRVSGILPLGKGGDRLFDSEVRVSINRYF